jgi:hypothetical protein
MGVLGNGWAGLLGWFELGLRAVTWPLVGASMAGSVVWAGWNCGVLWPVKGLPVAALIVLVVAAVMVLIVSMPMYSGLVRRRYQVDDAWSQIDGQLKQAVRLGPQPGRDL